MDRGTQALVWWIFLTLRLKDHRASAGQRNAMQSVRKINYFTLYVLRIILFISSSIFHNFQFCGEEPGRGEGALTLLHAFLFGLLACLCVWVVTWLLVILLGGYF